MEELSFNVNEGGNDVFASAADGTQLLITDLQLNTQIIASVVDFYIDNSGKGCVYIDGESILEQIDIFDYNSLEQMFYSVFSVEII